MDKHVVSKRTPSVRSVIVLMDTTYWGRSFDVMLFKDSLTGENLLKYYVKHEANALYIQGIGELQKQCFTITAIVCDGRKGLIQSFLEIPVQMCQFHQSAIIRRYLTKKPKLPAAKELMKVVDLMKQIDKESFVGALGMWFKKWGIFSTNEQQIQTLKKHSIPIKYFAVHVGV